MIFWRKIVLEELESILPIQFVQLSIPIPYGKKIPSTLLARKFRLPDTSLFLDEERFSELFMAWNEEGLIIKVHLDQPFQEALYPDYQASDSIELFIDTRDLEAGSPTRFCHHFLILPESVEGIMAQELTRFRAEEARSLANPELICVTTEQNKLKYQVQIEIAKEALYGFDPASFNRLGFTYRINRRGGKPQHFALSSREYTIERQPDLFATLILKK